MASLWQHCGPQGPCCPDLCPTWRWGLRARLWYRALLGNVWGLRYETGAPSQDRSGWDSVLADNSCFFQVTYSLHLYSVNGRLRASLPLVEQPTALAVTEDFVLLGTAQCALHILHLNK